MAPGGLRVVSTLTCGRLSGVDVFTVRLTRGLRNQGIDARILYTNPREAVPDRLPIASDVPTEELPCSRSRHRRIQLLRRRLTQLAPCLYLPNYDYELSEVCASVPPTVGTIGIVHSDDPLHYAHVKALGRYWDCVVAVSVEIARKVARQCPALTDRITTIPYGVDVPEPAVRPSRAAPLKLLYAGRIDQEQKRVLDLPRILDAACDHGLSVRLDVVGSGAATPALLRAADRHLQRGTMTYRPAVPNDAMPALYRSADVFVLPSAFEGLPVALLEAMSHGCIPVVTDIPSGIPEVVQDGFNGYRVGVGAATQFARRLGELAQDPALRRQLSWNAHETITARYSTERMVNAYLALFEETSAERRAGRLRRPSPFPGALEANRLLRYLSGYSRTLLAVNPFRQDNPCPVLETCDGSHHQV